MKKFTEYLVYPGLPLLFIIAWGIVFAWACEKEKAENAEKPAITRTVKHNNTGWGYGWTLDTKGKMHYGWGFRFGM